MGLFDKFLKPTIEQPGTSKPDISNPSERQKYTELAEDLISKLQLADRIPDIKGPNDSRLESARQQIISLMTAKVSIDDIEKRIDAKFPMQEKEVEIKINENEIKWNEGCEETIRQIAAIIIPDDQDKDKKATLLAIENKVFFDNATKENDAHARQHFVDTIQRKLPNVKIFRQAA